jgi:MFS family permease
MSLLYKRKIRTFDSLKIPTFRVYYFGVLGQWLATSMQGVVQSFLVYYLTNSAAILGTVALASGLPQLILLLFGGAFADRFQKKRLLQLGQIGGLLSALIILIALVTGFLSKEHSGTWLILVFTSAFSGICNGMAFPARQAMINELVPREKLMNAVSLSTAAVNVSSLIGPAIAGFLISGINYESVYTTIVLLFIIAIIMANFLPAASTKQSQGRTALADVRQGLKYIAGNRLLLFIIIFNMFCYFGAMPRIQLLPIFTVDILKVGASGQGIIQSATAVGALVISLLLASLPSRKRGLSMLMFGLMLGLATIVFAFSRSYLLSIVMAMFLGASQTGHYSLGTILLQDLSASEYIGRTMSLLLMCQAIAFLGTFFMGVIAEFAGVEATVGGMGILLILGTVVSLLFLPWIRNLD